MLLGLYALNFDQVSRTVIGLIYVLNEVGLVLGVSLKAVHRWVGGFSVLGLLASGRGFKAGLSGIN